MYKKVPVDSIVPNNDNPRLIKEIKFKKLVQSIKDFPEMLELRPIVVDEAMMVLGGNMRLRAIIEAGIEQAPIKIAKGLTEEQKKEFIVKDNLGYGEWDWDVLANEWDVVKLESWGMEINIDDKIDKLNEDEDIELPQSVQLEPPKEYILIMAEPNSIEWEELKETLKLKMVRRGGYKKGSNFDSVSLERVLYWNEFKKRINVNRSTE
jgi:hypothetical protein